MWNMFEFGKFRVFFDLFDRTTFNFTPMFQYSKIIGEDSITVGWLFAWFGISYGKR